MDVRIQQRLEAVLEGRGGAERRAGEAGHPLLRLAAPHRRDHACSDTDHPGSGGIDVLEAKEALGLQQLEEVRHLLGIEVALEDLGIALGRIREDGPTIAVDLGGRNTIDLRVPAPPYG